MKNIYNILKENIPLFNTISIGTTSWCNRSCKFCGFGYFEKPKETMKEEIFNKFIQDLKNIKYNGRVELYSYNEPLTDPFLTKRIKLVRRELNNVCIMFNTNGDFLTKGKLEEFFDAGLNQIEINVYSREQNLLKFAKWAFELKEKYNLFLGEKIYSKIGKDKHSLDIIDKTQFLIKGNKSVFQEKRSPVYNILGNNGGVLNGLLKGMKPGNQEKNCMLPYRKATIDWKGNVVLCCNDFLYKIKIGNIMKNTIKELWNSEFYNFYRLHLQNIGRKKLELCRECNRIEGFYTYNFPKVTFGSEEIDKELLKYKSEEYEKSN